MLKSISKKNHNYKLYQSIASVSVGFLLLGLSTSGAAAAPLPLNSLANISAQINKSPKISNVNAPVVAYVLLDNNTITQMLSAPKPAADRIIFSFLDPAMDPAAVNADKVGSSQYMTDIGLSGIDYTNLSNLINKLKSENIQVFFSVGGWLYSEAPGDAQNSTTNFGIRTVTSAQIPSLKNGQTLQASNYPFTSDMETTYQSIGLSYEPSVESIATDSTVPLTTDDFTKTWVKVANDFGVNGIDLDYEENWYSQAYTSIAPHYADWRWTSNGPVENTYASVKFGMYLRSLETNAKANGLLVSIAAPAIGAFDIHEVTQGDYAAGNWYWNTGVGTGTLKGVIYDIANYNNIKGTHGNDPDFPSHQAELANIFTLDGANILANTNLNEIGVMTYDLDDGYQNHPYDDTSSSVNSNYCVGWNSSGHPVSRDTKAGDEGTVDINCSIASQAQAIMQSYQAALAAFPTNLHFGLEVAYPNYPVNISAELVGGGDDNTNSRYRWNDPYIPFSIPVTSAPNINNFSCDNIKTIVASQGAPLTEMPYCTQATGNFTPAFLNVNTYLNNMKKLGGSVNGIIVWSLYNQEYTQVLLSDASNPNKNAVFSQDYLGYSNAISNVLTVAATGQQILLASCQSFGSCNAKHSA